MTLIHLATAVAVGAFSSFASAAPLKPTVAQTFFVPLQESQLLTEGFYKINSIAGQAEKTSSGSKIAGTGGMMYNMIALTISVDNTVVFYDHWEDGYEVDHSNPVQATTEVWGDGNAANGCAPTVAVCTDANDKLIAGTPVVITQNVTTNYRLGSTADYQTRSPSQIFYDGGDRVGSNYPVALVRSAFPINPGSRMAGACEVFDTDNWGTQYEAPLGTNVGTTTGAFEYVNFFVQSGSDGNNVTYQTGSSSFKTVTLNMGETTTFSVQQAYKVTSTKPIQVHMITGDIGSNYEMRWFAVIPTASWAKNYLSPLGDSTGKSKLVFYNPNPGTISVSVDTLKSGAIVTTTVNVNSKSSSFSSTIPDGSAAKAYSDSSFITLSYTDTETSDGRGSTTNGQAYDWGFPVMPNHMLTPQVMIGLGFGCTFNKCNPTTKKIHSSVWVSPANNADIYVDYNNNGTADTKFYMSALSSRTVVDTKDQDMSGALIWATKPNSGPEGDSVKIAACWGQDAKNVELTVDEQDRSLDLGTVVVPFPIIQISKTVSLDTDNDGDGLISPGDVLLYNIRVTNLGQVNIGTNQVVIVDDGLDSQLIYMPGTTVYNTAGGKVFPIADEGVTAFPLDEAGIRNKDILAKRGGQHEILFKVTVVSRDKIVREDLVNSGYAQYGENPPRPFSVTVPLNLPPIVPTSVPTKAPTKPPTVAPTKAPTSRPTKPPTVAPTAKPTQAPTKPPTKPPTKAPTKPPTPAPTSAPTSPPRFAPPGPYEEGACPLENTRTILETKAEKTPVEHDMAGYGFKLPEQKRK